MEEVLKALETDGDFVSSEHPRPPTSSFQGSDKCGMPRLSRFLLA